MDRLNMLENFSYNQQINTGTVVNFKFSYNL